MKSENIMGGGKGWFQFYAAKSAYLIQSWTKYDWLSHKFLYTESA